MIWKNEFEKISFIVEQSVKELYARLAKTNDFIPFLAFGDYIAENEGSGVSPYVIDNRKDNHKDDAWLQTLLTFLRTAYNFKNENTSDSKVSIFFEMMMYINIWESRPYLRHLKRIATLIEKNEYLWKLTLNDSKKSVYLEQHILPSLMKEKLKIIGCIQNGYEKQIRDAIAHNEYWHSWSNPEIILENYKRNPERIEKLHYNQWTEKFCYTFLLAYHLRNYFDMERQGLDDIRCKTGFEVKLMTKKELFVDGLIFYDKGRNAFRAEIKK